MPTVVTTDRTSPDALDSLEEFRVLARAAEAHRRARDRIRGPRLPNGARMAHLHAIADNPYVRGAFAHMGTVEMMRMCAEQLAANQNYRHAGHLLNQIAHHENVRLALAARADADEAEARPDLTPGPVFEPDPEPEPEPTDQLELALPEPADPPRPRRDAWEVFVGGLTEREHLHFLRIHQQEEANPPKGPRLKERLMPYLEARGLHDPEP